MRRAIRTWLAGGHRRPWGWRDAARHFGLAVLAVWVPTMHVIAIAFHS
jgi:hypothetical protein